LGGGNRNEVFEVRKGTRRLVARRSRRSAASLSWEVQLLEHLARCGVRVPEVVPALDGRQHIGGLMVMSWLDGRPPRTEDWPAVAAVLRKVHELTSGWPQRPDAASTRELLVQQRGGDVDLTTMPVGAVAACRKAWAALAGSAEAVMMALCRLPSSPVRSRS
jgi:Ser/Thr protein kinase RdoA (MazF antagonist)